MEADSNDLSSVDWLCRSWGTSNSTLCILSPTYRFSLLLLQIFKKTRTVTQLFSIESYKVSAKMDLRDYLFNNTNADPLILIHLFNMYLFMAQYVLDIGAELQGLLSKVNSPTLQDFWYNRNSSFTQNRLLSENKRWSYCWNKIWVLVCGQNISSQ